MPIYGSLFFIIFQIITGSLFDLLYRLASRRKYWYELSIRGVLSYLYELPSFLNISVEEQIKTVPFGIVSCFALIRAMSKKGSNDVRERCNSFCIHAGKADPSHILSVIHKQPFSLDPSSKRCKSVSWNL